MSQPGAESDTLPPPENTNQDLIHDENDIDRESNHGEKQPVIMSSPELEQLYGSSSGNQQHNTHLL